jgi:hypothetical protein
METVRLKMQQATRLRHLLACVLLLLLTPFAQAHESHHAGHAGMRAARAVSTDFAIVQVASAGVASEPAASADVASDQVVSATTPCNNHEGGRCSCTNACCNSPNPVELPAIQESRLFQAPSIQCSAQAFDSVQASRAVSPILAFAAPRAPPLPQ